MDDKFIVCPFNKQHIVPRIRLQYHIVKCKKNYPNTDKINCPYNATEYISPFEYFDHLCRCKNKRLFDVSRNLPQHGNVTSQLFHLPGVEASDEWTNTSSDSDSDSTSSDGDLNNGEIIINDGNENYAISNSSESSDWYRPIISMGRGIKTNEIPYYSMGRGVNKSCKASPFSNDTQNNGFEKAIHLSALSINGLKCDDTTINSGTDVRKVCLQKSNGLKKACNYIPLVPAVGRGLGSRFQEILNGENSKKVNLHSRVSGICGGDNEKYQAVKDCTTLISEGRGNIQNIGLSLGRGGLCKNNLVKNVIEINSQNENTQALQKSCFDTLMLNAETSKKVNSDSHENGIFYDDCDGQINCSGETNNDHEKIQINKDCPTLISEGKSNKCNIGLSLGRGSLRKNNLVKRVTENSKNVNLDSHENEIFDDNCDGEDNICEGKSNCSGETNNDNKRCQINKGCTTLISEDRGEKCNIGLSLGRGSFCKNNLVKHVVELNSQNEKFQTNKNTQAVQTFFDAWSDSKNDKFVESSNFSKNHNVGNVNNFDDDTHSHASSSSSLSSSNVTVIDCAQGPRLNTREFQSEKRKQFASVFINLVEEYNTLTLESHAQEGSKNANKNVK